MQISVDISLYPLTENYKSIIIYFIERLKPIDGLQIEVNGMSSQIFGEYDVVMNALKDHIYKILEEHKAMFMIKIGKGNLTREELPEQLKK